MKYVLGNWKMHTSLEEARVLASAIHAPVSHVHIGIAPPASWLVPLRNLNEDLWLGAQHAVAVPSGAFTGDLSVHQLAPHVDFILIGHSERRQYHPVPDADLQAAVVAALDSGTRAVLCVGEHLEQRASGNHVTTVLEQLAANVPPNAESFTRLLVAYEPVWAIGTGKAATPEDAEIMCRAISEWFQDRIGTTVPILYGGSVNAENANTYLAQPAVGGLLVGGASLSADSFNAIVNAAALA